MKDISLKKMHFFHTLSPHSRRDPKKEMVSHEQTGPRVFSQCPYGGSRLCRVVCVFKGIAGPHWGASWPALGASSSAAFPDYVLTSHLTSLVPLQWNTEGMLYSERTEDKLMRFSLSSGQDLEMGKTMEK